MSEETKVITGKVRFCYVNVFEAKKQGDSDRATYSVTLVIPKNDDETFKKISDAMLKAYKEGEETLKGKSKTAPAFDKIHLPIRDGDVERPNDAVFAGSYFINATSMYKPGLIDANKNIIVDTNDFYSGCYGRASIVFYAYNNKGNTGIACSLRNLQKFEDGEKLGGVASAFEDFSD